ncbi:hypothetical protein REPUB_Repub11eG0002700 [Reevesia pubescens]
MVIQLHGPISQWSCSQSLANVWTHVSMFFDFEVYASLGVHLCPSCVTLPPICILNFLSHMSTMLRHRNLRVSTVSVIQPSTTIQNPSSVGAEPESSTTSPKGWVLELTKSYGVRQLQIEWPKNPSRPCHSQLLKAALLPDFIWTKLEDCAILLLVSKQSLQFWKYGDEKWHQIDNQDVHYDDIIAYKGQFFAVDESGTLFLVDSSSSLTLIKYMPVPIANGGNKKNLVESDGDLYLVDKYFNQTAGRLILQRCEYDGQVMDIKVYKLEGAGGGGGWVEIKDLGDRALFVSDLCSFFVSTRESSLCRGNCIYYIEDRLPWYIDDIALFGSYGDRIAVFDLKDRKMGM